MQVMLSFEPRSRAASHTRAATSPRSSQVSSCFVTNSTTASLSKLPSNTPSQDSTMTSLAVHLMCVTSGSAITFCWVGPAALPLYCLSPYARDTARFPSTRPFTTSPPHATMRAFSSSRVGLWSVVIGMAVPSRQQMTRLSPTLPTCTLNVGPADPFSMFAIKYVPVEPDSLLRAKYSQSKSTLNSCSASSVSGGLAFSIAFGKCSPRYAEQWGSMWPSNTAKNPYVGWKSTEWLSSIRSRNPFMEATAQVKCSLPNLSMSLLTTGLGNWAPMFHS
mmetsp:Transcript_83184/g.138742  ORF Transcript_83184/g.138742 Transcript_83184/m.138742 type:complete len:276 (+) Transcript_83184:2109-2936(+)